MSQQGYVAAPPYSQAQPGMGGYQGGFGGGPAQPLYGHYGGPPQAFAAPPAGKEIILTRPPWRDRLDPLCPAHSHQAFGDVVCRFGLTAEKK